MQDSNRADLKLDRQRRVLHKSNLPITSRKIGPEPHQLLTVFLRLSAASTIFPASFSSSPSTTLDAAPSAMVVSATGSSAPVASSPPTAPDSTGGTSDHGVGGDLLPESTSGPVDPNLGSSAPNVPVLPPSLSVADLPHINTVLGFVMALPNLNSAQMTLFVGVFRLFMMLLNHSLSKLH